MLCSSRLISHENKLLRDHLKNVGELSQKFIEILTLNTPHNDILADTAYLIGISHDFAKATTFFQNKIKEKAKTVKANHSYLSSLFTFWLTKKFIKRAKKDQQEKYFHLPLFSWLVVAKHHGNLENFSYVITNINFNEIQDQIKDLRKNRLGELNSTYNSLLEKFGMEIDISEFLDEVDEILKEIEDRTEDFESKSLDNYFELILLYSALIDADRLDASLESNEHLFDLQNTLLVRKELKEDLVEKYKKQHFENKKEIDRLREKAYNEVLSKLNQIDLNQNKIFSIDLPTGLGKTLTSFSFALKLRKKIEREKGYKPKIIYSLPFLSIIDQNAKVIENVLKYQYPEIPTDIFLKHHHLSDITYTTSKKGEECKEYEKDVALLLIESWYSEVIITTFVQLFESLISSKNRAIRKVHNIANSIIILDEFQAIPCEYWKLTKEIIKFLAEKWGCYIIIMTATMPMLLRKDEMFSLINRPEDYFENENLNRYTLYIDTKKKTLKEFYTELTKKIDESDEDILVVLNTVRSSQKLYELLKDYLTKRKGKFKVTKEGMAEFEELYLINLNSNIVPFHRIKRIEKIKKEKKRKIIVSTQLVEAGVDIDVGIVYRDFAPIDSIVQSAGRCNRNGKRKGKVFLTKLISEKGATYSTKIYGIISEHITEKILHDKKMVEEKEIRKLISTHFEGILEKRDTSHYLSSVCELNFSEGEAISTFSLIEEEFGKEDFCVLFNNAKEIINEIIKLKKKRRSVEYKEKFKVSAQIETFRRKLESFIISPWVPKNIWIEYQPNEEIWNIRVIENPEESRGMYDIETGFNINKNFEERIL